MERTMPDVTPRKGMPSPRLSESEFPPALSRSVPRSLEGVQAKLAGKLVNAGENLPQPRQK
jgi:hypothetical protein